ncbi:hypothetical protein NQ176_g620 [Zarea fungicola]|uniref:Uncharacterized protein n=1 Tax=Zarea fungicola TaxID=93591 RepID=A0ACC1NWU6_9HYPO|nr:hypothetical protein NQ176_g620 [Lecanicillium fungicola]
MFSSALWYAYLAGLVATASAANEGFFYGKNSLSKLLVKNVAAEKNCGCNGTWDRNAFPDISKRFGGSLAQAVLNSTEQIKVGPISIGENTYTLSADGYSFDSASNTTIWTTIISDMLAVAAHSQDHSIITGDYIHTVRGTHTITLTVYGDLSCSGIFKPCKAVPTTVQRRGSPESIGPGLDWSDPESVKKVVQLPRYNSSSLHKMITANKTLPMLIYLEDSGLLVDTASIQTEANSKLQARQGCPNTYYDAYSIDGTWSNYGNWLPISNCLYTNLAPSGGSLSFTWGYTMSYAESMGWGGPSIISSLSPAFSFSISQSYSNSNTYSCNVPGNSVGQLWFQNLNGYGYVYKQTCHNAGACGVTCGSNQGPNYSGAPGTGTQFGCSNGASNVNCNAYDNWAQYSVWSQ